MVDACRAELGEGPNWDAQNQRLIWVDILRGSVLATDGQAKTTVLRHGADVVCCVAPLDDDRWLMVERQEVSVVDNWAAAELLCVLPTPLPEVRANDGKLDPAGRLVVGTMHEDGKGAYGSLYSISQAGVVAELLSSIGISNGLAWNEGGDTMFYIDTPTGRIDAFDYDVASGFVANRRPHVVFDSAWGSPDGMTIDSEGCLWVACWGGSAVRRFDADGQLAGVVQVGALNPTSCAFDGANRLFITSASTESPRTATDGALWAVDV